MLRIQPAARFLVAIGAAALCAADVRPRPIEPPIPAGRLGAGPAQAHEPVTHDRPAPPAPRVVTPALPPEALRRGKYQSVQVNVDDFGENMVGDAANEPSIAVDPTDPKRLVIGWRQFDSISSNFRQAGWAYSRDAGRTWTFPGMLQKGVFRTDPCLDTDREGSFYYFSLSDSFLCQVFKSTDGGLTWGPPVEAFGGDKNWMVVDRTAGIGRGNIYCIWQRFANCCGDRTFTRSTDGGASFIYPVAIPGAPTFGTLAVGPDGEVYAAGIEAINGQNYEQLVVAKSTDAKNPAATPTFVTRRVDLGGGMRLGGGPNPAGLLGQAGVAVDHSGGPTRGYVYLLCSVDPPGPDPLDVTFTRSADGGQTWSPPRRINDDAPGTNAWQWFGTLSVAPDGRIDVVWNDTRNGADERWCEVFYSSSTDAGATWLPNEPITPAFNSHLGWPQQAKLGDYYHMVSDKFGADLAYAATFNEEQDVYYVRLRDSDCNGNGIPDSLDISSGRSKDCNRNAIPDECEPGGTQDCNHNGVSDLCDIYSGHSQDCNRNNVPDECDIASGFSTDANGDGIPDECSTCQSDEVNKLVAPDAGANHYYGYAVALSGSTALVGAWGDDHHGPTAGAAYVLRYNGAKWTQTAKLLASDAAPGDRFGAAVALDGDTAVVGAYYNDQGRQDAGAAYVFYFDGQSWVEQAKLVASDATAFDYFGYAVSIAEHTIIVGAWGNEARGPNSGAAYIFEYDGDTWVQRAKLVPPDGSADDRFGVAVALSGNIAIVGAYLDDERGQDSGSAHVFHRDGENWIWQAKLIAPDGAAGDRFGRAVAISGDTVVVGAYLHAGPRTASGSAYVFRLKNGAWTPEAKLRPGDGSQGDQFGYAVALSADVALIGAFGADEGAVDSGAAYVFQRFGTSWVGGAKLVKSDAAAKDYFGSAVALDGNTAVIGAYGDDQQAVNAGAAEVFRGWLDCNGNRVADVCDIARGTSQDANRNGIPDECEGLKGDLNCDGVINESDIDPFVLALTNPKSYAKMYPKCNILNADCNADGQVNNFDIDPFAKLLKGP